MFTPRELALVRGWPGRIEGDKVVQLAAQTLQSFFTGGGNAREHAEFSLADVDLRAPVLHPPTVRDFMAFEEQDRKSTRLNSSHSQISYAVFCLKKKKKNKEYIACITHN